MLEEHRILPMRRSKMKSSVKFTLTMLCGLLFILAAAYYCSRQSNAVRINPYKQMTIAEAELMYDIEILVPTFEEIQKMLVLRGYDVGKKGIDNDLGTDTLDAWEKAICNRHNAVYFEGRMK